MYTILLVDDEPYICKGLSHLLQHSGLAVGTILTAGNGQEALDYLRLEDVDLIVYVFGGSGTYTLEVTGPE